MGICVLAVVGAHVDFGPSPTASSARTAQPTKGSPNPSHPQTSPFQGAIHFQFPGFGNTLTPGQDVYGTVTKWSTGFQVWLFVRPEGSSVETPSGPCPVSGENWTCTDANLPGASGREYLTVVVVPDAEAAGYSTRTTLPHAAVRDETQAYKG